VWNPLELGTVDPQEKKIYQKREVTSKAQIIEVTENSRFPGGVIGFL
jgi:hypothetical protein